MAIPFPDISPIAFSIDVGIISLQIRWYALGYAATLLIGWIWGVMMLRNASLWKDSKPPMTRKDLEDYLTWLVIGVIAGGRLGYVLFYQPGYYLQNPLEIIAVWKGGLSFHGGALGVIVTCWVFCHRRKISKLSSGDLIAVGIVPGIPLVRTANFINAELWGKPTTVPWGVVFPGPAAQTCPPDWIGVCARHPSQLYEAFLEGIVLMGLLVWLTYRKGGFKIPGQMIGVYIAWYGFARVIIEFFRQADPQYITPDNPWGHVLRLGASPESWGLTMGQLLSLPMLIAGVAIIVMARRRA